MIFSPVAVISLLMIAFLPRISQAAPAYADPGSPPALTQPLAAEATAPEDQPPAGNPAVAAVSAVELPAAAAIEQPAAAAAIELPVELPADMPGEQSAVVSAAPVEPFAPESSPAGTPGDDPNAGGGISFEVSARAAAATADTTLEAFAASLNGGSPEQLAGVYVAGLFALPVVEQPANDENFVSSDGSVLTRFRTPSRYGVTGILAHNYLSGSLFYQLQPGQEIVLVYGGGNTARYRVAGIHNYQALSPHDVYSDFRDLNGPGGETLSASALFNRIYTTQGTLVLQTCIEANGEYSWGRMFIIAEPVG